MITTPSSSALTTMYRLLGSSSSVTVPPSIAVGLRLRPDRLQPGRRLTDQVFDFGGERRTAEDMITIGIYRDLAAADDDMQHDFVGRRMPAEHRFEAVRKPGVTVRNATVDDLAPRRRYSVRVVPQPRHVGDHRRSLYLGLDLRFGERDHRAGRARAPGPRIHFALHNDHFVRLEQQPGLLEHAREQHDVDGAGEVFQSRVSHDLALSRDHPPHLAHQAYDANLRVFERACDLDGLRVRQLGQL